MNKSKIKIYIIALAVLVIILVLFSLLPGKGASNIATTTSQGTQSNSTQNSLTPTNTVPTKSVSKPATVVPQKAITNTNNYNQYITQLYNNQSDCKNAAQSQYDKQYAKNMEQSAFQSFYNQKTGACYMQITGNVHPAYTATTTSYIYFINVNTNAVAMVCSDVNGTTFSDSEWKCEDKKTGQMITKAQYNANMYNYTVK